MVCNYVLLKILVYSKRAVEIEVVLIFISLFSEFKITAVKNLMKKPPYFRRILNPNQMGIF